MKLDEIKKIYFIGMGGIGVSAVAKFFKSQSAEVSGSDLEQTEITDECVALGIKFFKGHRVENVPPDAGLVVYSDAVPQTNPERQQAARLNIPQMSYGEILGEISKTKRTIAVSGTNGKSTTTAMLGLILEAAGLDPTVIVGSKVRTFPYGNLRLGAGEWIVIEGDEYRGHMLHLRPEMIVLTNLKEDHLDYYKNLDDILEKFENYLALLLQNGVAIFNADDFGCRKIETKYKKYKQEHSHILENVRMFEYGLENDDESDFQAVKIAEEAGIIRFKIKERLSNEIYPCALRIPGRFNVYNALAAVSASRVLGVPPEIIQKTLANFLGTWRRFEKVGEYNGALIISDYGHHPTAIRETVAGARKFYPGRRIVLVFQPHQHNRTRKLFNEFVEALESPDVLILSEIYNVAGRIAEEDKDVSSRQLVEKLKELNIGKLQVEYGADLEQTEKILRGIVRRDDLIIIMGAGDIDKIARKLCQK